jgi:hypothetical protein
MKRASLVFSFLLFGCGGGGGDAPNELQPWETVAGVCSFDDEAAETRAIELGAQCRVTLMRNTLNGEKCPAKSWPSDGVVNGSTCGFFQESGSAQDVPFGDFEENEDD